MIKFSKLFETVYEPRSGDEKNFKDKHVIMKIKTPYDTESQFTSDKPKAKRKADYDTKDDESVYEAANVHTKRADKEAVIVRAVDPKTGQSKARVVQRRAGEIKIGEEVDQLDETAFDIRKLPGYKKATKNKVGNIIHHFNDGSKIYSAYGQSPSGRKLQYHKITKDGEREIHSETSLKKSFMNEEVELEEGTVGHGKYTITTGPRMSGMGEGGPSHVVAKRAKRMSEEADLNEALDHESLKKDFNNEDAKVHTVASAHKVPAEVIGHKSFKTDKGKVPVLKHYDRHNFEYKEVPLRKGQKLVHDGYNHDNGYNHTHGHFRVHDDDMNKSHLREETDLNEADVKYVIKHKKTKQVLNTHDDYATAKDEHEGLGDEKSEYGVYKQTKKDAALRNRNTYREEVEQIDEISKKTLGSYIKKASQSAVERRAVADRLNRRAFDVDNKDSERYFDASDRAYKKHKNRLAGIAKASDRLTKEEFDLNEAVKVGAMHLHDGSSVTVTREMADVLNNVLEQLNPMNRVKMEQKLHTSKKDFMELLKFAENI